MWWEIQRRFILWGYLRRIRKHGWTGTYVPGDETMPAFAYSVGFWKISMRLRSSCPARRLR